MNAPLIGGVLVGGQSRRMGRPKQLVEIGGGTMIEHVVRTLSGEVEEVVLLGGGPVPSTLEGLSRVADADDCQGPMAGIVGALRADRESCWVIAPCDMPLLRRAAVKWLVGKRHSGSWAVMPSLDGFVEPLLALYEPESRELLEAAAAAGEHALHRLASSSRVVTAEPPAALRQCWFNANTPHKLASLRAG
ncbi:MAG: molybdenum cofactor guanylyltransferase [Thermoanaerobaculales bacterium]|nr:molybdenum cofactor guanylyltransferase [Thermoanaerobaculales bacterium]